jgi:hypothetical protein
MHNGFARNASNSSLQQRHQGLTHCSCALRRSRIERVMLDRNLDWEGCFNARDLGGLPTVEGRRTRWGAVVRSDSLDHLTTAGWSALEAHGIRTIVDLRNDEELEYEAQPRPDAITPVHVPLDDIADTDFWKYLCDEELDGTPLLHRPFLERKPARWGRGSLRYRTRPHGHRSLVAAGARWRYPRGDRLRLRTEQRTPAPALGRARLGRPERLGGGEAQA